MEKKFTELSTGAFLKVGNQASLEPYKQEQTLKHYTFIWSTQDDLDLRVDALPSKLGANQMMALTPNQYLKVEELGEAIVYQFNREFYCIKDHDKEVSCAGLLFFGSETAPVLPLDPANQRSFELLHSVLLEEMDTEDTIQAEMLRMMVARLMIKLTRIYKETHHIESKAPKKVDLFRHFNMLVEEHFREQHSVSFYAEKLFKSPKTLSNSFASYQTSPLQIIHQRIVLEAKRLLNYTDMTTKEIAYSVGFDDASHLSRLFKKQTGLSPTSFKSNFRNN